MDLAGVSMSTERYRIVPCPREGHPNGVMIEQWAPDETAAAQAGLLYAPRDQWPHGWLPLSWHASLDGAQGTARRRLEYEREQARIHQERAAAWAEMEICV